TSSLGQGESKVDTLTLSPSQQFTVNSQPLLPFSCVQSFYFSLPVKSPLSPPFLSSHLSLSSLNSSCASYVGFQGGAQSLYFGRACNVGNLCHELMHALGLHHEHTRPDRDQYVTIQWDNVVPGYSHQHNILNHLTGITCGSGAGLVNLSPEELQCVGFSTSPTLTYLIQLFVVWSEDCTELTINI
uniref:Metalloendopeptidase n=1 Tax=Oncorhynchus tshawytscha TaxID=74940 RepID=A0AAZ3R072_ONCTS